MAHDTPAIVGKLFSSYAQKAIVFQLRPRKKALKINVRYVQCSFQAESRTNEKKREWHARQKRTSEKVPTTLGDLCQKNS